MKHKIPSQAKLAFKGQIFDVYQWKQEMYNGSTKTFERLKRPNTVIVIPVTEEGKIIICQQEQPDREPYLSMISGRIDTGEEPLAAGKRELLEETGYESDDWILYDQFQPFTKMEWEIFTFIAKDAKKVAEQNLDGGEKIELKFVDFDEFIELLASKQLPDIHLTIKALEAKLDSQKMARIMELLSLH
jgi:ADP-ribose pyrophosphatase